MSNSVVVILSVHYYSTTPPLHANVHARRNIEVNARFRRTDGVDQESSLRARRRRTYFHESLDRDQAGTAPLRRNLPHRARRAGHAHARRNDRALPSGGAKANDRTRGARAGRASLAVSARSPASAFRAFSRDRATGPTRSGPTTVRATRHAIAGGLCRSIDRGASIRTIRRRRRHRAAAAAAGKGPRRARAQGDRVAPPRS